ncbi:glycosyltransferase [Roseomonas soli]|uniref:Glycosyltransferase n=2 Tax=Neoroseomonas soli TaxID=1081025 RepID=A0A9X9X4E2_9PROT|nr:glycosyltransferase [Neoroseomonas soli]
MRFPGRRMNLRVLILFARAPRLGAVKRRLAAGIGARAALRFHVATLAATARAVGRDRRWRTLVSVTPPGARADWVGLLPRGVRRVAQPRGDLGQRMERAMRPFRFVLLAGSDIPGIRAADIAAGFAALGRADAVFGPAEDGGYWLVGMGPRRPARPFAGVRWSTEHALADTLRNFGGRRVAFVRRLRDVDTAEDLVALGAAARR